MVETVGSKSPFVHVNANRPTPKASCDLRLRKTSFRNGCEIPAWSIFLFGEDGNDTMIKLLVFDLDGTIVDSKAFWKTAVYKILRKNGYAFSKEKIEKEIGQKRLLATLKELKVKEAERIKREINQYTDSKACTLKPCPNIGEIKRLRLRYATCLLTNSTRLYTTNILKKLGLELDFILGAEDVVNKIEGLKLIAKNFKVKPHEILYIADMFRDIEVARKFGCQVVLLRICSWDKKKLIKSEAENVLLHAGKLYHYLKKTSEFE